MLTDQRKTCQGEFCPAKGTTTWSKGTSGRESASSYYRARYYNSTLQRFVSEDPIGNEGGWNHYEYAGGDPVSYEDPLGFSPTSGRGSCNGCPGVPPHPPNVNIDDNIHQAQSHGYKWWYDQVCCTGGPWDYKNYDGQPHPEYDDFGNFNYGATGTANGIDGTILERAAGWVKWRKYRRQGEHDPYGNPLGGFPYGNEPEKEQMIRNGMRYYRNGCIHP